jgi:hypothetical protein
VRLSHCLPPNCDAPPASHPLRAAQGITDFEAATLSPSDGACSVVRAPGSAAALVRVLDAALEYFGPAVPALSSALRVLAMALLCNLYADGSPPGTDKAHASWRAAANSAGAVPVLRRVMAAWESPAVDDVLAASAAALLQLLPDEAFAAGAPAGAGGVGTCEWSPPERDGDFSANILIDALNGEPAGLEARVPSARGLHWPLRGAKRGRGARGGPPLAAGGGAHTAAHSDQMIRLPRCMAAPTHRIAPLPTRLAPTARAPGSDGDEARAAALQTILALVRYINISGVTISRLNAMAWLSRDPRRMHLVDALRAAAPPQQRQREAAARAAAQIEAWVHDPPRGRRLPGVVVWQPESDADSLQARLQRLAATAWPPPSSGGGGGGDGGGAGGPADGAASHAGGAGGPSCDASGGASPAGGGCSDPSTWRWPGALSPGGEAAAPRSETGAPAATEAAARGS